MREAAALLTKLVGDRAGDWEREGVLPLELLRKLGAHGLLCAQVPSAHGGRGWTSRDNGAFTAHAGSLCGSLRSVMTSQGMAAWAIERLGDAAQRDHYLRRLTCGELAAAGFSEPQAGSDPAAMTTQIRPEGDSVVVDGRKAWVAAAHYADLLVIGGKYGDGAAAVVVPSDAAGVRVERVADPPGCRAAGHATVVLDSVRLPGDAMVGAGATIPLLVSSSLAYGRMSMAWGCVGILRACLEVVTRHRFGRPLSRHQRVAGQVADLVSAEGVATRLCEYASACWDSGSPEMVIATVLAKYESARRAAAGAEAAVRLLAEAGTPHEHIVARAYRDAKLMEIIEDSNEMCLLVLADHAVRLAGGELR
ncbi:acyl-CoA dehydrogenase family protein [Amycolatopsis pigmentata]|uniref:Acyl-CoA dehydrogenase family protein n=1 Tax=Amycolatopsis pigmentata TaxID=450801 RepID=A0ABW5FQ30_9PSEU